MAYGDDGSGGAGGFGDLLAAFQDPAQSDALASKMAAHYGPPSGEHDFTQGGTALPASAPQAPQTAPDPAGGAQDTMQLGDIPKYKPPGAPMGASAGGGGASAGKGQDTSKQTAALANFGQGMMKAGTQPQQAPPAPKGGPQPGGAFNKLPGGIPQAQPIGPQAMMPQAQIPAMGGNAMMPPQAQTAGVPPSLAQLYGRPISG